MWTAFGIMIGNVMGVAFGPSTGISPSLGWRLMLGSTVVLPLIVCAQVYFCPESPRWYIQHHKPAKAFRSFQRLRPSNIQAARDTYYTYVGVELERKANKGKNLFVQFSELFTVARNRRATLATWIVMFGQQFCGVNVIACTSLLTSIFLTNVHQIFRFKFPFNSSTDSFCRLFDHDLRRIWVQHQQCPPRVDGHRYPQLGIRHSRSLHHRYLGSPESSLIHFSLPLLDFAVDWLQLLVY